MGHGFKGRGKYLALFIGLLLIELCNPEDII
jgi:hypothetical protein